MVNKGSEVTTFSKAFDVLSQGLQSHESINTGSFWEFIRDVWALGFEHPEYFRAWHIGVIAEDIQECVEEGKNYVAVLPRFHFKSTVLGHAFSIWRLLQSTRDQSVLYLSYSDGMAKYHISEINKAVHRNPVLKEWFKNKAPKADFSFRYSVNNKPVEIMHGGLFSFKRGMHVNGALIADDVLRDPENPLNASQLSKVEDHFLTESMFIPLKGVPVIVLGTPMMPGDLLTKLQKDDRFKSRVLPALDPVPDRRVLMPELYNEEWLLEQQKARPKSFASEFMLIPHFSTESYFEGEDIEKCEDKNLRSFPATKKYELEGDEEIFAGFDVGKKRHPSHLVLFKKVGTRIEQIHQSWLDGWSYSDQIEYLNEVADNFKITKGYIDNTRGELEDRGLDRAWYPMHFTVKAKNTMAQIFEKYVLSGNLSLLKDERQKQQILSVNNELKAPETPMGHGDAFFSIALALQALYETTQHKYTTLGSLTDWAEAVSPNSEGEQSKINVSVSDTVRKGQTLSDSISLSDDLQDDETTKAAGFTLVWDAESASEDMDAPNPHCVEAVCTQEFWVPERNLCLYCGFRGKL